MAKSYVETLITQHAAGGAFNTFTTAKLVTNGQAMRLLDPGFWTVGRSAQIRVRGAISNIVTTPGLMNFQVKMGTLAAPITVWDSGNVQLNATAHTLLPFALDIDLRCDSEGDGTLAKLIGVGVLRGVMFTKTAAQVDGVNTESTILVPVTTPAVGTGFDSTIANLFQFWSGFSISNAGNGITVQTLAFQDQGLS